jgi:type IV pilus assembly protein PilM
MAKRATTIYIDNSAIWVLVARGKHPRNWASMPLEPDLVMDGVVRNQGAVASKIKKLWRTHRIETRKVIAGISGINCLYRLITLPELPKSLLPEAVKREASRALAIPLEELYLSWQTLPTSRGETLVYLVASPRNSVDALISTLRKAGLNPYLMDLRPLALARTTTESQAIILDVQPASFDIVVLMEGIPQVVRSLPLPQESQLEEKMSVIEEELDRAVTFYNSSHVDKPIEAAVPLLVCGELVEQPDAWRLLTGRLQRPVQALPTPMETTEGFPASQYMTNMGLALKGMLVSGKGAITYSLVNFNALPEAYRPKRRPLSEILLVPVIIAGIALIALGAFAYMTTSAHTADLHANLANISQLVTSRHDQFVAQSEEITALSEQVPLLEKTVDAFATTLDGFTSGRDEVNGDLGQINSFLPGAREDRLLSVTHSSDTLTVEALFSDKEAVFHYAGDLRASGRFVLVVITDMHTEEEQIGFTLTLTK